MKKDKKVSREQFFEFLENYPNKENLDVHVTTICEPPIKGYYDFDLATAEIGTAEAAFQARIAHVVCDWMDENGKPVDDKSLWEYYIDDKSQP